MADDSINVGSVAVSVVPDASNFATDLRAKLVPQADQIGREIAARISGPISDAVVQGVASGATKARAAAADGGNASGGAFADTFRARVDAALRDLPTPRVGVDATEADAELADIRERLRALGDVTVGVDLRAEEALAELDALKARIDELGARSPDINVKVDAAKAAAELAAVQAEVDALNGEDAVVNVEADTSQALGGISGLTAAIVGLGPALIPVGAAATVGLAGIATAAGAGAAGLGVLALGYSDVSNAVKLLGQEHTAAAQQAAREAAASGTSAAAQVAAANQVKSATESLALARTTTAQQEIAAAQAVANAQYAKTQADQQEAAAQTQLNNAREQAARDLESASNRVVDTQLAAKQAAIDVTNAQATYNATLSSGTATQLQRQQAALDLAKAQQALIEANEAAKQAEQDNTAAQKAGVNGAPAVVAANQAIATAKHSQQQAGQQLTDAERAQTVQRQQSAFTIEQAQRAVTAAYAAQAKAAQGSGTAGSTALALIQSQLAKTNPAVLAFATFFTGTIDPMFTRLKNTAATGLLPGVEAGLKAMTPLLAPFTKFVGDLASTMGFLFAQAGKALTSPFWVQFFSYIQQTAGPTLVIMAQVFGGIAQGIAGLLEAFGPLVSEFGAGLARAAASFAQFGAHLSQNSGFQKFLDYVRENGPRVMDLLGQLFKIAGNLSVALAPLGAVILQVADALAHVIGAMNTDELLAFVAGIGVLVAVLSAPEGGLLAALIAIVAVAALIVNHWSGISKFFTSLWDGIVAQFTRSWHDIRDVIDALTGAAKAVGSFFTGPFVHFFTGAWADIRGAFSDTVKWISGRIDDVVGFFTKMPGRITRAAAGMWDGISDAFRGTIDLIIHWWDSFVSYLKIPGFSIDTHIPGVGKIGFDGIDIGSHLQIPYLASGGVTQAAALAVMGERGSEAILPLTDPNAMQQIADAIGQHDGGRSIEVTINNPKPEPSSLSLPKALRRAEFEAAFA